MKQRNSVDSELGANLMVSEHQGSAEGLKPFSHYIDININDEDDINDDDGSNDEDFYMHKEEIYKNSVKLYKQENCVNKINRIKNKRNCKYSYKILINDDEVVNASPYKHNNVIYKDPLPTQPSICNMNNDDDNTFNSQKTSANNALNKDVKFSLQTDVHTTPKGRDPIDVFSDEDSNLHSNHLAFSPDFLQASVLSSSLHSISPQSFSMQSQANTPLRKSSNTLTTFPKTCNGNSSGTVPYLGIFFTDLTMLHSALPDFVDVEDEESSKNQQLKNNKTPTLEEKEINKDIDIKESSSNNYKNEFLSADSKKPKRRFSKTYFDNEGNTSNSSKKWINFSKKRKEWEVIAKLQFFQTSLNHYNLYKSQHLLDLFNNLPVLDDKTRFV